ncbi:MAG TPA: SGNH/GDSL hydrolase family protein [Chloroflexota bacterium]|nr:SGNH/GDSL hydrolase family protein [Chloroflexota bacterium]
MSRVTPLGILILFLAAFAPACAATQHTPIRYYLALGDSLTVGTHVQGGIQYSGDRTCRQRVLDRTGNGGWVCIFYRNLRKKVSTTRLVNLALNGEDTCSFIAITSCNANLRGVGGGSAPPYDPTKEPQLQAALAFLKAHPGSVDPITLEIGANDFLELALSSSPTLSDVVTAERRFQANYDRIVAQVHAAAPHAHLILFDAYNPVSGLGSGFIDQGRSTLLDTAVTAMAAIVSSEASRRHATFADLSVPFHGQAAEYVGDDHIHPNALGQRAVAAVMWSAYRAALARVTPVTESFHVRSAVPVGSRATVTIHTAPQAAVRVVFREGAARSIRRTTAGAGGTATVTWRPRTAGTVTVSLCSTAGGSSLCLPATFQAG